MKILVTDDSRMARKMLIKTLSEVLGDRFELFEAENGEEAYNCYKQNSFDIVFLDLTMPVMDGFEALKLIKEYDNSAKVVVVSADIQKTAVERVLELGALSFIKKPIDSQKMTQIFEKLNKR